MSITQHFLSGLFFRCEATSSAIRVRFAIWLALIHRYGKFCGYHYHIIIIATIINHMGKKLLFQKPVVSQLWIILYYI